MSQTKGKREIKNCGVWYVGMVYWGGGWVGHTEISNLSKNMTGNLSNPDTKADGCKK